MGILLFGANGGTRTRNLSASDFKSDVYASSTTFAQYHYFRQFYSVCQGLLYRPAQYIHAQIHDHGNQAQK